jgi:hypothetical protein
MNFSLVHASRQRLTLADLAIREWRGRASGEHAIEHLLSVDADDPELDRYRDLAARHGSRLVVGQNRTMVEAVNRGAAAATGEVLVSISDDFGCPHHWDRSLAALLESRREAAVIVNDGLGARIMTLPILTRAFFERLGHIYHPAYVSLFADDDLTDVARRADVVVDARDLVFPHRHFSAGLSDHDATYARQNSDRSWWHGWLTYEMRKIDDFGPRLGGLSRWLGRIRLRARYFLGISRSRVRDWMRRRIPDSAKPALRSARNALVRLVGRITGAGA